MGYNEVEKSKFFISVASSGKKHEFYQYEFYLRCEAA